MNNENIEFALNHISEEVKKTNGTNEYIVKALEALADNIQTYYEESKKDVTPKSNNIIDTRQIEYIINSKISEIFGFLKSQKKEVYINKSYFLYPEGKGKNALLFIAIKAISIVIAAVFLFLTVQYVSVKIEDNSENSKYRIVLQYLYAKSNSNSREYIETTIRNLANDSTKVVYLKSIDECPIKLK